MRILGCCGRDVHYSDYSSRNFWCGVGFLPWVWVLLGCECVYWHVGHWIPRQVFHEHLPFARIGMWGFFLSLFLCLHCVLGVLGVLDQGADSTLRDPEVQVLLLLLLLLLLLFLLLFFSFSFWDWVF